MSNKIYFLEHNGKKILYHDLRACTADECVKILEEAKLFITSLPVDNSLLGLNDVRDAKINTAVIQAAKEYAKIAKPYSYKSAIVGVDGLKNIMLQGIIQFSNLNIAQFDTIEKAKDWLAA
jgi:hypothetical protein